MSNAYRMKATLSRQASDAGRDVDTLGDYDGPTSTCLECGKTVPSWFICVMEHGGVFQPSVAYRLRSERCFHCWEGYPYPKELGNPKTEDTYVERLREWKREQAEATP